MCDAINDPYLLLSEDSEGFCFTARLPLPTGPGYLEDFGTLQLAKAEI
jgi:hypothetical protein